MKILKSPMLKPFSDSEIFEQLNEKEINSLESCDFCGEKLDTINWVNSMTREREADNGNDLYTILNVIQEKLIRGGIKYTTKKVDDEGKVLKLTNRVTKKVDNPSTIQDLNKFVFSEALKLVA